MKIKFQFTSQIAMVANKAEESVEMPNNATIQDSIDKLLLNKSQEFKNLLFTNSNTLLPAILLIKNGTQIDFADNEVLIDGDEILIFSPM